VGNLTSRHVRTRRSRGIQEHRCCAAKKKKLGLETPRFPEARGGFVKARPLRRFEGTQSQYMSVFSSVLVEMELNLVVQDSAAGRKGGGPASSCCIFIALRGRASQAGICA
jgi:hypothetical protein